MPTKYSNYKLVVFDLDSTLIQCEVIDELAREAEVYTEVAKITARAMAGKLNFDQSLKARCKKLSGLSINKVEKVLNRIKLTPGAKDLIKILKKHNYKCAIISGGFTFVADKIKEQLGMDFVYANTLEVKSGKLTGNVLKPIINAKNKADLLKLLAKKERIPLKKVVAIGDGANDILMLKKAGLGIAFNAKPVLREHADFLIDQKNLCAILPVLGISKQKIT